MHRPLLSSGAADFGPELRRPQPGRPPQHRPAAAPHAASLAAAAGSSGRGQGRGLPSRPLPSWRRRAPRPTLPFGSCAAPAETAGMAALRLSIDAGSPPLGECGRGLALPRSPGGAAGRCPLTARPPGRARGAWPPCCIMRRRALAVPACGDGRGVRGGPCPFFPPRPGPARLQAGALRGGRRRPEPPLAEGDVPDRQASADREGGSARRRRGPALAGSRCHSRR